MYYLTFKLGSSFPANANKRVVFPDDGGPNKSVILQRKPYIIINIEMMWKQIFKFLINYLEGLITPETSLRIVTLVVSVKLKPSKRRPLSAMFKAALGNVGRALFPMWQFASTVTFSNLTSTVGNFIRTLP